MTRHELLVQQFCRRIAGWCVLRQTVTALSIWAFLWGTAVLALRATSDTTLMVLLWGLIGVPIAVALAVRSAFRQIPNPSSVRALLDAHGDCGGLLMASEERDLGQWAEAIPQSAMPRVSWNCRKPLIILGTAVVYLLLGFLLPIDRLALASGSQLDVSRETDRLAEQVRVLKEEKFLDKERAESLKQKLDQVQASSKGTDPAKTLEALDHLNDLVRQTARKASETAARQANQLSKLETAAEAMQKAADGLDEKTAASLMAELAAMAKKAAEENEELKEAIDGELAEALAKGKPLTPEQLSKLAAAARSGKEKARNSAQKLYNAKLIDADELKECKGECKCDGKGLAEYLKKNGSKQGLNESLEALGKGGVGDDPPGNTPIQFGEKSSENGAKFREEALPPAGLAALKESLVTGVSGTAPKRDTKAGMPTSGALAGSTAGGGSANTGQVLPQHKGPVERYFDRPAK